MSQRLLYKTKVVNIYIFITETIEGLNKVKKIKWRTSQAIRGPGVTTMTWGAGECLEGSSHSHGTGAQLSFPDRNYSALVFQYTNIGTF